ncbi:DUF2771 domain-containing protein [Streptomyces odontomachi]|uniref:DUF2771 domain-containing protein n=1 Tax=Streptomyces odontomachi TaxID=2944940 RepID=UPI0021093380|nr:DUF2771 domain-containing protein [Streptomyces sp. ODS25]
MARLGTFGAVCAGLAVLSGCQKPTPLVTVTSGRDSVHAETDCYDDGRQLPTSALERCLRGRHKTLGVDPDAIVRFGVDPVVADRGWAILLNGRPLSDVSHKTYRTIPASVFFDRQYGATGPASTASVLEGSGRKFTGLWSFTFTRKS